MTSSTVFSDCSCRARSSQAATTTRINFWHTSLAHRHSAQQSCLSDFQAMSVRPSVPSSTAQTMLRCLSPATKKIGRAHVCTPVTHAHLVCSLLLEKQTQKTI